MSGLSGQMRRLWVLLALMIIFVAAPVHAGLVAKSATTTSVTLSWTAPSDGTYGNVSTYDIRYSTTTITETNWGSATQVANEPTPLPAGSTQTFTVSGLTPNTTYYFAAKASDGASNWSPLSSVVKRSTPNDGVAPATISNLLATATTQTSATLTWTAPGDDGSTGTATVYDIRYSLTTITAANFYQATKVLGVAAPKTAGSTESLVVPNLIAGTTYFFAIKTADEWYNWSGVSNVASNTTTGDNTPPAAVTDLTAN